MLPSKKASVHSVVRKWHSMDELNYYELLDLDPEVEDGPAIEKRLLEKQRLWSRQATEGTPRDARLAARNLKLLDSMRRTLADPAARASMASQARRRREQQLRESRTKLSELLEFARGKVEDIDAFVNRDCARYVRELGRAEVLRLIAAAGIKPVQSRPATPVRREMLEPTTAKRVRDGLEHLGKSDLYDFLGLSRRCSARSLRERAEQINRTLLQSGRSDDQTAAGKELAGQCMAVFASEEGKERYNNTLTEERLDAALRDFLALAGQKGVIGQKETAALLTIAGRQGIAASEASAYIRSVAQRRKWVVVDDPPAPSGPELPRCGYCGCLARSAADSFCWNCNRKLTIPCPKCGRELPSSQKSCTECGANIEDAEIVESCFKAAGKALEDHDPDEALEQINRCLALWPDWSEAAALKERIEAEHCRRQATAQQLVTLLRERRMLAAQDCLEQARKDAGEDTYARASEIVSRTLADANRLFLEGENFRQTGDAREAVRCYEQALTLCSDLEPALERLKELPPDPPADLDVQFPGQATVRLTWKPGRSDAVFRYTVTRKADGVPAGPKDGETMLEDTAAVTWDDTEVPGGVAWHYAVFSLRRGVPSAQGASAGPIFLTPPVTGLNSTPADGHVRLEWTLPSGALGVDVRRKEHAAPKGPDDGASVTASRESALDTGLVNGRPYFYALYAVYADPEQPGKQRYAPAVTCRVIPAPHLEPIQDLRCLLLDATAYLTWTPPTSGEARILCAGAESVYEPGRPVPSDSLEKCGETVPADSPGSAVFPLNGDEIPCFIPLTLLGRTAVPGTPCRPIPLGNIDRIESKAERGRLLLTWSWPEQVEEVLICWSATAYPEAPDSPQTTRALCSLEEYQKNNGFVITAPTPQKHYICIYAKIPDREAYASGTRHFTAMGLMDTVQYRVARPGLFRRESRYIELHCETLEELGGLQVRGREDRVPLAADEGILLMTVPSIRFRGGVARLDIPTRFRKSRLLIKLFLNDPEYAQSVRLMPGHTEELKLW